MARKTQPACGVTHASLYGRRMDQFQAMDAWRTCEESLNGGCLDRARAFAPESRRYEFGGLAGARTAASRRCARRDARPGAAYRGAVGSGGRRDHEACRTEADTGVLRGWLLA